MPPESDLRGHPTTPPDNAGDAAVNYCIVRHPPEESAERVL
jgi:hypothetical protein